MRDIGNIRTKQQDERHADGAEQKKIESERGAALNSKWNAVGEGCGEKEEWPQILDASQALLLRNVGKADQIRKRDQGGEQ